MSTTVKYKGNTLTTVSNATKTLKTAGKYMEGDVILTDMSTGAATIESLNVTPSESAQTFNSSSVDGYKPVTVSAIKLQNKSVIPTEEEQTVMAGENHDITFSKSGAPTRIGTSYTGYYIEELDTTWMEEGTTYHVTGSVAYCGYNSGSTKDYTVDTNYIFDGTSDFSLATTNVKFEMQSEGLKITVPISNAQGDRNIKINGELTFTNASNGYDGLKQVTVEAIPSTYIQPTGTYLITTNGTYNIASYASAEVNVSGGATVNNQNKTVTPTTSQQSISADSGYTGLGIVTVNAIPSQYIVPSGNLAITANGTGIDVTQYASVSVDVPVGSTINNQDKTVTPTESQQTITADEGYTGLGTITVNAISSTYVGSEITQRDGDDLTASGATVSVPAGYYSAAASKSVATGTEGAPTASKGTVTNHSISITPSVTNTAGYISGGTHSGTAITVSASELVSDTYSVTASGTHDVTNYASASVAAGSTTAPASISGTAASVSTGSGTLTLTKTVSVTPTVSAGYITSGTAGNSSVSLTANVAVNPTLTVSGPTVTAPAGYYTENTSKSVTTMTPPSEPSNNYTSGYTRLKVIDRATSTRYINIPPGYNSTGVYYQISAVHDGSATTPATTITANPTITISDSGLITATASASQSVTPTVSAGYVSSGTAGTITVSGSKTQQLTTKAAATITPTTTNQTIASGTYLTGTQTILGDPDLVGPNIVAGASIFNINGTATFQHYYTGSSAPASSLGNNGDIYLQA